MKTFWLGLLVALAVGCGGSKTALMTDPGACVQNSDCPLGVCDAALRVCVQCLADRDCATGQRCTSQVCVGSGACEPGGARCSSDGKQLLTCSQAGDTETPSACAAGQVCITDAQGARCSTGSCTPGSYGCSGSSVVVCGSDGATLSTYQTCDASEYCDARRTQCVPQLCVPGSTECNGATVQVCNDQGSARTVSETCSLTQQCMDGTCVEIACVPNTQFCQNGQVWQCNSSGTGSTPLQHCAANEFCLEQSPAARCSATQCTPASSICQGNVATICASDGSGPVSGGTDCSLLNQLCYSGECRDAVCTPGQKLCDHGDVYLCAEGGTSTSLLSDCTGSEVCDADTGSCKQPICTPGTLDCDSSRVVTCSASGLAWQQSGPDCAASNQVCQAGACVSKVCTPSQTYCQNNAVFTCNAQGIGGTLYQNCGSSYTCVSTGSYAYCQYPACTANSKVCSGTQTGTCKSDGSGVELSGTDCATTGQTCSAGACVDRVCTPNTLFCKDNSVNYCSYDGLSSSVYGNCGAGTLCSVSGNTWHCYPTACSPSSSACLGEKLGTCASDGSGLATVKKDCGSAGQVCTLSGCADSAVDALGGPSDINAQPSYYNLFGDIVQVETSRVLTQLETQLDLPATRTIQWLVYQLVGGQFQLKAQSTTSASGNGVQTSGTFNQTLVAGNAYYLGISVSGGSFGYYSSPLVAPQPLSFGSLRASMITGYASVLNDSEASSPLYYLKATTSAP